ncbi:MAG: hypothetical protein HQM10_17330 [Candidatus Riflebacteria bacterium]|nr:hypothetical protein [Candidatus Riflebacteria bacterium]
MTDSLFLLNNSGNVVVPESSAFSFHYLLSRYDLFQKKSYSGNCTILFKVAIILFIFTIFIHSSLSAADDQAEQLIEKAEKLIKEGKYLRAKVYITQAKRLVRENDSLKAVEYKFKVAVKEKSELLLRSARFLKDSKRINDAINEYKALLSLDPGNEEAKSELKQLEGIKSKVKRFQETGIQIPSQSGRSEDVEAYTKMDYMLKAKKAYFMGNFNKALEIVDNLLKIYPEYFEALELKNTINQMKSITEIVENAETNLQSGKFKESLDFLNILIAREPERVDLLFKRGVALLKIKSYYGSIQDLEKVLFWKPYSGSIFQKNPVQPEVILPFLAEAYLGFGKPKQAYALSFNPYTGGPVRGFDFRVQCLFEEYKISCIVFSLSILFFLCCIIWFVYDLSQLLEKYRLMGLLSFIKWFLTGVLTGKVDDGINLKEFTDFLHIPWLNYVSGLHFLNMGDASNADEMFRNCHGSSLISLRAEYFRGISGKILEKPGYDINFESVVTLSSKTFHSNYIPDFVKKLELELLEKNLNTSLAVDSNERMAWNIVNDLATKGKK